MAGITVPFVPVAFVVAMAAGLMPAGASCGWASHLLFLLLSAPEDRQETNVNTENSQEAFSSYNIYTINDLVKIIFISSKLYFK